MTQKASITLDWVPEIYICTTNSSRRTGYQLAIARKGVNSTLIDRPHAGHIVEDMLELELIIHPFSSVQTTHVNRVQTAAAFASQLASTIVAILSAAGFVFAQAEKRIYKPCFGEKPHEAENEEQGASIEIKGVDESSPAMPPSREEPQPENAKATEGAPPPTMGHSYQVDENQPRTHFVKQV